ncbi:MAG TPA: adenylate/guanylate cyclase domain-containing protein [Dehalococcoidia bacterium]
MAEPQIQYVKTSDGVNIAYATAGSGPPLVWIRTTFLSHVQLEWEQPVLRSGFEAAIAAGATLVRFDPRGTGLSDRDVDDVSSSAFVRDLEAVVGRLQLDRFALLAIESGTATAIKYAIRHPEQVSRLVLLNPAGGDDGHYSTRGKKWIELAEDDWELLTENTTSMVFGFGYEESTRYAEFMRAAIDKETFQRLMAEAVDLAALGAKLQVPTLVIKHTGATWLTGNAARELAAAIPDCRMVSIEGTYVNQPGRTGRAMREFLAPEMRQAEAATSWAPSSTESQGASGLRTVLFTDVAGHTEMMSRLGDERGREVLREHERITREVLAAHGGTEVKTMGDGFMASFGSVIRAVECAIAMQKAFAERKGEPLSVRVGLNAGEPIEEDGDLFGATVILASRIAAKADGGEILVADTVRGLCSGKGFLFSDRGEFLAKGFEEPVRVYEVSWRD